MLLILAITLIIFMFNQSDHYNYNYKVYLHHFHCLIHLCLGGKLWIRPARLKIITHILAFQKYQYLDSSKMNFQLILDIKNASNTKKRVLYDIMY